MTLRIRYSKDGAARWLGHLDVMRAFERAFRRAAVSVALTEGFNPRPKLRFVFPTAVGLAASEDVVFADLVADAQVDVVLTTLNGALPSGLRAISAERVPTDQHRAALLAYDVADYTAACDAPGVTQADVDHAVERVLACDTLCAWRGAEGAAREIEIRRHLVSLEGNLVSPGLLRLGMSIRFGASGTAKPSEVVQCVARALTGLTLRSVCRDRLRASGSAHAPATGLPQQRGDVIET